MGRLGSAQKNEFSVLLNLLKEFWPNLVLPEIKAFDHSNNSGIKYRYEFYVPPIPFSDSFSMGIGEFDFH
ncbi:hypothetical protein VCR3J2_520001 [Vibrio coralliirubri]|nr:hypothetical protein VCR3J2_520001 [Vibrio coralliirubri]